MKIAPFGGKFDPPHFGHVLVIDQILEQMPAIDEVWLVPVSTHPWKEMVGYFIRLDVRQL